LFGPTSCGKSEWVRRRYPQVFLVPLSAKSGGEFWLDGYNGERQIFLDEFRAQVPLDVVKVLCDQFPTQVPYKGGFVPWSCDTVIFASQHHPDDWWPGDDRASALDRAAFAGYSDGEILWLSWSSPSLSCLLRDLSVLSCFLGCWS